MGVPGPSADAVCDGSCSCGVRLGNGRDVHPLKSGQVIEMHDVIVQCVPDENQVADVLRVCRNLELERIFNGAHRGDGVDRGANSAEALRKNPAFAGIASEQNRLDSAPHGAARPCLLHGAPIDLDVDAQVPFDASYRVYRDASHNVFPSGSAAARCPGTKSEDAIYRQPIETTNELPALRGALHSSECALRTSTTPHS